MIELFGYLFAYPWWLLAGLIGAAVLTWQAAKRLRYSALKGLRRLSAHAGVFLLLVACVLLLTGVRERQQSESKALLLLIDTSGSVGAKVPERAMDAYAELRASLPADALLGVAAYDGRVYPLMEMAPVGRQPSQLFGSRIQQGNPLSTSLQSAIEYAPMLFPPDCAPQIVLVSDGQRAEGLPAFPLTTSSLAVEPVTLIDAAVGALHARSFPSKTLGLRAVAVETTLFCTQPMLAEMVVTLEGKELLREGLVLERGQTAITRTFDEISRQSVMLKVEVIAEADGLQGNESMAISLPRDYPKPRVLVVDGSESFGASNALKQALSFVEMDVQIIQPRELVNRIEMLDSFQALYMVDVLAEQLPDRVQEAVHHWVLAGGGFGMIGGPEAYALAGFSNTSIEKILPLHCSTREDDSDRIALTVVADVSGSMGKPAGSGSKLDQAMLGTRFAYSLLEEGDAFTLIAYDSNAEWRVDSERLHADDRDQHIELIRSTDVGGGGIYILPAMEVSLDSLVAKPAPQKILIVFTDAAGTHLNDGEEEAFFELMNSLPSEYAVRTSIIGLGRESDQHAELLRNMADASDARLHFISDAETLPALFARETAQLIGGYLAEGALKVKVEQESELVREISYKDSPMLRGMIRTRAKDDAQVHLSAGLEADHPIFATRRHGLGRSLAFTSDARDRWASNWLGWEGFALSWQRWTRWLTAGTQYAGSVDASVVQGERSMTLQIAHADQGAGEIKGVMRSAAGASQDFSLIRKSRDVSEVTLPMDGGGTFHFTFWHDPEGNSESVALGEAWVSRAELNESNVNESSLLAMQTLSRNSGGLVLTQARDAVGAFPAAADNYQQTWVVTALCGGLALMLLLTSRRFPSFFRAGAQAGLASADKEDALSALAVVRGSKPRKAKKPQPARAAFGDDQVDASASAVAMRQRAAGEGKGETLAPKVGPAKHADGESASIQKLLAAKQRRMREGRDQ